MKINDVTLRDGMHALAHQYTVDQMVQIAKKLDEVDLRLVELTRDLHHLVDGVLVRERVHAVAQRDVVDLHAAGNLDIMTSAALRMGEEMAA